MSRTIETVGVSLVDEDHRASSVCIVVPAYNEAARLDATALERFAPLHPEVSFLFVDDGSTDSTFTLLTDLAARLPSVRLMRLAKNSGKAEAVRLGLLEAWSGPYEFVGYWDADWATPLDDIPLFAHTLRARPELQLALGSRVALLGRQIDRKWYRHYLGRVAATCASVVLGIPVYDTQCGAKLMRSSPQMAGLFSEPFTSGWIFDVEMIARYLKTFGSSKGIYEIALERWQDVGESKVKPVDFLRSFAALARIYRIYRIPHKYQKALIFITAPFVRYVSAGAIGTALHYATVIVSVELFHLIPWVASALGATLGAVVNYLLNYHFIFASTRPHHATLPRFVTVATMSVVINTGAVRLGADLGIQYLLAQAVGTAIALVVGYGLNKAWTFRG